MQDAMEAKKRSVLWAAVVFSAVMGIPLAFVPENSGAETLFGLVSTIGCGVLVLMWCQFDSFLHGRRLGTPFRILVVLFGLFALVPYLFWSRGPARGIRAIGLAFAFIVGLAVVAALTATLTSMALES